MKQFAKKILKKVVNFFTGHERNVSYDFNKSNPLGGSGERVDIQMNLKPSFNQMDIYQKNHWRRYEFAKKIISKDEVCGDFACGTGYGSIMLSDKVKHITGADLDEEVIIQVKKRYGSYINVDFLHENILNLNFSEQFDSIISFETFEHFEEYEIENLLSMFHKALKIEGRLIFSVPYMQVKSEEAIKMGFHLTFYIDEEKIKEWLLKTGFKIGLFRYQNYETHEIENDLEQKEIIICVAYKVN